MVLIIFNISQLKMFTCLHVYKERQKISKSIKYDQRKLYRYITYKRKVLLL